MYWDKEYESHERVWGEGPSELAKAAVRYLIEYGSNSELLRILDIGCGYAIKLMKFIHPVCNEVYGIDQENIINFCRKKYNLNTFLVDDIENSKLDLKKKFDLINPTTRYLDIYFE